MAMEPKSSGLPLERRLALALAIAAGAALLEAAGSWWSGSLALLTDAGHIGTDAAAIGISLGALRIARRPHTPQMSFGYHRIEVLAAFVNAVLLAGVASSLAFAVYNRLAQPRDVHGETMLLVGLVGLAANLAMVSLLGHSARRNINVRGAFLHAYGDTLGSAGVVVGAALIALTHMDFLDTVIALLIVALIAMSTGRLLRDSVRIILEGSPADLRPEEIAEAIRAVPGVRGVHDLHVWTLTSDMDVASAHLMVRTGTDSHSVLDQARVVLRDSYSIAHATLQVEPDTHQGCDEISW
jgi:cobalt-zinc-cadmium efflux system protein